jgi:His-Xaa-Ser system radical SAM maturase HxsC
MGELSMIALSGNAQVFNLSKDVERTVVRLTDRIDRPQSLRASEGFLLNSSEPPPDGFRYYIGTKGDSSSFRAQCDGLRLVLLPKELAYLQAGDILRIEPKAKRVRVLYRRNSANNHFLVTERCNSFCLMCSQPPRKVQDGWIIDEIAQTIPLMDPSTKEIGFTGGEPVLLGDRFFSLLRLAKSYLPHTAVHVLSNGRCFADPDVATRYARVGHTDIVIGIPLYSDLSTIHDFVVQADGAYDETLRGILNLKRLNQRVEIRVVVHQQTYERLPRLAEFIARNLTFVDRVAFMGLEITGFTRANLESLWIDPFDYQAQLCEAVLMLDAHRMHVSVYNHQRCVLDRRLWRFARKSISDWKNEYMPECRGCAETANCGGFFSSAKFRYSEHIRPIPHAAEPNELIAQLG